MKRKSLMLTSLALAGAILAGPAAAQVFDGDTPGSVLVFPKFQVRADDGQVNAQNATQIRIANESQDDITVHLLYVCGKRKVVGDPQQVLCPAENRTVDLTGHETWVRDVETFFRPSCKEGYIIAYAYDGVRKVAISHNRLKGSYHIFRTQPNRQSAEQAIAIQSPVAMGADTDLNGDGRLDFDGAEYRHVANTLDTDFRGTSFNPLRASELTLLTLDVRSGGQNFPTRVGIDYWNEYEVPFSASHEFFCWDQIRLDHISSQFRVNNLGSLYGLLVVTPLHNGITDDPTPRKTILGAIREVGQGFHTMRNLYHDQVQRSTAFIPDGAN